MPGPWYARRELELALLVVVVALAAIGANAWLELLTDEPPAAGATPPPAPAAAEPLEAWAPIAARDLFNGSGPAADAAWRLVGVGFQGGEARAAIENTRTRRQELVRTGDVLGENRVDTIAWDHVVLRGAGGETVLELAAPADPGPEASPEAVPAADPAPPAPAIRQTAATAFVVDRSELAGAVEDMSGLLTQLRAVAEVRDGRPAGFRLFQMKEDSIFRRLGLKNGDVVQRVNGEPIADPASLLAFLQRLRTEPRVALDIRRGSERQTLVYDLR
jgi:general secretion pathway protein C